MIPVGTFVLDRVAKHADDTGSAEELGVRGIVTHVITNWLDEQTGEVGDRLIVATRHHGHLAFVEVMAGDVAEQWPCGRIDAGGYITVCQRTIARAKRGSVDPRVVDLLALATRVKESPASPPVGNVPPAFPTQDERDAYFAEHPDEAAGWQLRPPSPDMAAALAASTEAHRARNEQRETNRA